MTTANPNNARFGSKIAAAIVAALAAGSLGGYAITAVSTPSITIGNGTPITKHLSQSFTIPTHTFCNQMDVQSLDPCLRYDATSTFTGVLPTDSYSISPNPEIQFGNTQLITTLTTATDTVTVHIMNVNAVTTTIATSTFTADIWRH